MAHITNDSSETYFEYLKSISALGLIYRRHFLYPRLAKHCRGSTLDVGCGTGEFLKFMPGATGVDINEFCVSYCEDSGLNAVKMDVNILPFCDASFESIILDNVLEHIGNPKKLLDEIHRVLQSPGRLIIGVPLKKGYSKDPDHKIFYDVARLRDVLEKHNFKLISNFETPLPGLGKILNSACLYGVITKVCNEE